MAAKKRRSRSRHPGVVLLARTLPSGRKAVQARFVDPDTGRTHKPLLDLVALPTVDARILWAKQKSAELAKRRMQIAAGADPTNAKPLQDALKLFRESAALRLRPKTVVTYELAIARLLVWAGRVGVKTTADLTRARLADFRAHLMAAPHKSAKRGARRGTRTETARKRSPVSVNVEMRSAKALLNAWRVAGLLQLDRDAIADGLKPLPTRREQPEYLRPAQLQELLEAAGRHDAEVFAETRGEHRGLGRKGTTRRYRPIADFTAFLLLSGCRRGEALALRWDNVDLDALDGQGRVVGEIRLRADQTKTHRARTIGLDVSPGLRTLLAGMKLRATPRAEYVFGDDEPYTVDLVESARSRLIEQYGAPKFAWQVLRSTCATYLTNAPGIYGSSTVFRSADQLGHSVNVAQKHYLGVHRGISKDAHGLEDAMQVERHISAIANRAAPASARPRPALAPIA